MLRTIMAAALVALSLTTHSASVPPDEPSQQTPVEAEQISDNAGDAIEASVYGKSGNGRDLICYRIGDGSTKLMLTFTVHGFEDQAPHDGSFLTDMAETLMSTVEVGDDWSLYFVPTVNPDGVIDGWTENGPGRCQLSMEIDLNRDFDWHFVRRASPRNRTLRRPLSAPESRALADLVNAVEPDYVVDFHGWEDKTKGDPILAEIAAETLGLGCTGDFTPDFNGGAFAAWAGSRSYCQGALLVEYPPEAYSERDVWQGKTREFVERLMSECAVESP